MQGRVLRLNSCISNKNYCKNITSYCPISTVNWNEIFGKFFFLCSSEDPIYIFHIKQCAYCVWPDCLHVLLSFLRGQWTSGWVWAYLEVREETGCLCSFFNSVRTPWSASVQTVVLICTGFWQNQFWISSDSLHFLLSCCTLAGAAPSHWSQLCQPSNRKF